MKLGILDQTKWLLLLIPILQACQQKNMKFTILDKVKIDKVPSGSGIVASGKSYYVIGDDSPFLYCLNDDFRIEKQYPLLDTTSFTGRIAKSEKPDFEALELIGEKEIVVFGSGSRSPQRDIFTRILLKDAIGIEHYAITSFYDHLRNLPPFKESELNIEAAAYFGGRIFLFNRKKNLLIRFDYLELLASIKGEREFPMPEIKQFHLPKIKGMEAGFSGATALKGAPRLLFTASVEDTDNAYQDGEILGSFLGIIDLSDTTDPTSYRYCRIPVSEEPLKVESISVSREIGPGKTQIVLVTDDDRGNSLALKGELLW